MGTKIFYHFHKRLPFDHILSQLNPFIVSAYSFKITNYVHLEEGPELDY